MIIHRGKTQLVSVALCRQEADFVTENGGPIVLEENQGFIGQLLVTKVTFEAIEICENEIIYENYIFHRRLCLKIFKFYLFIYLFNHSFIRLLFYLSIYLLF